jgi:4-aminobutyrate aminotransferase-like enzyme/Ser/Thr protein kinase RdoA (MazF antagonist)/murein DD-endopeptidase MepM/ murein hydrolase activator NlpD
VGLDDHAPVPVLEEEAERLARELYGLEADARALPGEYDANFHLITAEGPGFVLKVMHPGRERALVELQCAALEHLARRAPGLTLPRVRPTTTGASHTEVELHGETRLVWMLSFIPGTVLAVVWPRSAQMCSSLGRLLGEMDRALAGFTHPAAKRKLKWDLSRAGWVREHLFEIEDTSRRVLVEGFLDRFESEVVPLLPRLRRSVIHGDANDHNVLVESPRAWPREVVSVVDFGDMHRGLVVAEPAVAAAYAVLGQADPLEAATQVVAGYHRARPLEELEVALLHTLVGTRLAVSVANAAHVKGLKPDDPYVTVSEAPAWDALEGWAEVHPRLAHYTFREACGLDPVPGGAEIQTWLRAQGRTAAATSVLDVDLRTVSSLVLDLGVSSRFLGADPQAAEPDAATARIFDAMEQAGATVGVGRYDEARGIYLSGLFGAGERPTDERRTVHLGIDLFVAPGSPLHAPLDGVVHILSNNTAPQDYGPLVILRHETNGGESFFTLYGHLTEDTLEGLTPGETVWRGQVFARVGTPPTNGGWSPHLHIQIILDLLERGADFPGVARASQRGVWTALSPDPNLLLGIPAERFPAPEGPREDIRIRRERHLLPSLAVSYRCPLEIVRGWRQWLYDETGRAFLDAYNNVPLVGHGHPRVVRAAQDQLALLNTNTRYLHDEVVRYAERLTALLPEELSVCAFVNSGSEANELALRLARTHTGHRDVIVLEHAYHGHTTTLVEVSPYKFDGPGGGGRPSWVHVAPLPDDYRGPYRRGNRDAGVRYARHVGQIAARLRVEERGLAAFLCETLPSVAGQIVFPPEYLSEAYRHARGAGGVCIADEVQTGFGRLGTHRWGFETQAVVPDIVVLGKPMGNGFPLGAVVTSREIAESFDNGMEFFSTFGGNPVAAAVGLAVLDVLEDEGLQENARRVGGHLLEGLRGLQDRHQLIGDVRGSGLFLGVELVRDRETLEPATEETAYVVERLRERGVLTGADGPHRNVLKLRPPLAFSDADADLLVTTLDEVLAEDGAQV